MKKKPHCGFCILDVSYSTKPKKSPEKKTEMYEFMKLTQKGNLCQFYYCECYEAKILNVKY